LDPEEIRSQSMKQPYEGGSEENVDLNDAGNGEAQDEEMRQEVGEFKD
jgi:hypothetical protein